MVAPGFRKIRCKKAAVMVFESATSRHLAACGALAAPRAMCIEQVAVLLARVLASSVRVVHEARRWLATRQGVLQGGHCELAAEGLPECPANDPTRVQVEQHREVRPPLGRPDV